MKTFNHFSALSLFALTVCGGLHAASNNTRVNEEKYNNAAIALRQTVTQQPGTQANAIKDLVQEYLMPAAMIAVATAGFWIGRKNGRLEAMRHYAKGNRPFTFDFDRPVAQNILNDLRFYFYEFSSFLTHGAQYSTGKARLLFELGRLYRGIPQPDWMQEELGLVVDRWGMSGMQVVSSDHTGKFKLGQDYYRPDNHNGY